MAMTMAAMTPPDRAVAEGAKDGEGLAEEPTVEVELVSCATELDDVRAARADDDSSANKLVITESLLCHRTWTTS
jgi:hypothetical protein